MKVRLAIHIVEVIICVKGSRVFVSSPITERQQVFRLGGQGGVTQATKKINKFPLRGINKVVSYHTGM